MTERPDMDRVIKLFVEGIGGPTPELEDAARRAVAVMESEAENLLPHKESTVTGFVQKVRR